MKKLQASELYKRCDPDQFTFKSTAELPGLEDLLGQERAHEALHFGVGIAQEGFNLFVLGPHGVGKHTMVRKFLDQQTAGTAVPPDWVYLNNFKEPDRPLALPMPPGQGVSLKKDMKQLVEDLRTAIHAAFEAEEYQARRQDIEDQLKDKLEHAFTDLNEEAELKQITVLRTPHGFALAPLKDGSVISPTDFEKMDPTDRGKIEQAMANLENKLNGIIRQQPQWQRDTREKIKALNREVALFATGQLITHIKEKYQAIGGVDAYLNSVQENVIENISDFRTEETPSPIPGLVLTPQPAFERYEVNVLVDNSELAGVPAIYENNPTFQNLIGRIEHKAHMGALFTDFTLVKPGALHRANGGYLLIDAHKILRNPFAWDSLKRALFSREVDVQSMERLLSLVSTTSLEPQPIPLNVKVLIFGDRLLYYLLHQYDDEFPELFKVAADFDDSIDWNTENAMGYAKLMSKLITENNLNHFDAAAVARVIEHGAREVGDTEKLTTNLLDISDLLREADYWCKQAGHDNVQKGDVQKAIDSKIRRSDRMREKVYEQIKKGIHLIDTGGAKTGQINGLAVLQLGQFAFAKPSRITATARLGEGNVIDIEREVELGGALHSKGVFILSSFLAARYAKNHPLSLSASIAFEQSYGMVEGDSASMAELCALLSALSDVPIKQNFAITGSVNQMGCSQPIGGVNEKIEGFFDVCTLLGELTGDHSVIIPSANVKNLMLRPDVVAAVEKGLFQVYAVDHVDDAMELLTGIAAGERTAGGLFPQDTVNFKVESQLIAFAETRALAVRGAKQE